MFFVVNNLSSNFLAVKIDSVIPFLDGFASEAGGRRFEFYHRQKFDKI